MSASNRLIINCGSSSITAAVLSSSGGSLHLEKLVSESLNYDLSNDSEYNNALAEGLKSIVRSNGLSGKATFIIAGHQVLTKTIRIPNVEAAKQAQIIAFEAQQNIPYPLHEVVWDSQILGDDGVETEVLFIACKTSTIDDFCSMVASTGLVVEAISPATILEYNALQFSYSDATEDTLLINVGARSTTLLFSNADAFFVRNIALGGNSLTQSIADSLGKTFAQAEEIKRKFISGGLNYSEDDSGAQLLKSSADGFLRRMGQEVTRSIVNYRRQRKGAAPKRILLSGRGSLYKGLAEHLSTSQKVAVELFDPLKEVILDADVDSNPEALRLSLGEIIGEASRTVNPDAAGVNLLPEAIQSDMRFAKKKPLLLIAAACLAIAPWPAFLGLKSQVTNLESEAQAIRSATAPLQDRQATIQENTDKALALRESIARVEGLVNSKVNWIHYFADLQDSLYQTKDVWIDDLEIVRDVSKDGESSYEVVLLGQMLVRETAEGNTNIDQAALSNRIRELQAGFESSEFIIASKEPQISWANLFQGLNVLPFKISLIVDPNKPL
ncbi:MAG: pilus assembly protein PilM [Verrucomicrobiota bacterium]